MWCFHCVITNSHNIFALKQMYFASSKILEASIQAWSKMLKQTMFYITLCLMRLFTQMERLKWRELVVLNINIWPVIIKKLLRSHGTLSDKSFGRKVEKNGMVPVARFLWLIFVTGFIRGRWGNGLVITLLRGIMTQSLDTHFFNVFQKTV